MRILLLLVLALFAFIPLKTRANTDFIRECEKRLKSSSLSKQNRILLLNDLSIAYLNTDLIKSENYNKRSFRLLEGEQSEDLHKLIEFQKAEILKVKGILSEALFTYLSVLDYWIAKGEELRIVQCLRSIGENYRAYGEFKKANFYLDRALYFAKTLDNKHEIAKIYDRKAAVVYEEKNYTYALQLIDSAFKYIGQTNNYALRYSLENIKACSYSSFNHFDLGLKHLLIALKYNELSGEEIHRPNILNNLAAMYIFMNREDIAVKYCFESYELSSKSGIIPYQREALLNLVLAYKSKGDFKKTASYLEKYNAVSVNFYYELSQKAVAELEAKHKLEKETLRNQSLIKENQLQNRVIKSHRLIFLLLIAFIISFIAWALIFLKRRRKLKQSFLQISQQKAEIEQKTKELGEINLMKDRLFSIIAHDIKNPLNTIIGFSDVLKTEINLIQNPLLEQVANHIHESSLKLHFLLDNLLQWSRSQLNIVNAKTEFCQIKQLVDESVEFLHAEIQSKNISINNAVNKNDQVCFDNMMLQVVLRNLVSNAVKFTNPGGIISIWMKTDNEHKILMISDNGIGMTPDQLAKVFSIDKELGYGTCNEKGSGVGLSLCKEFVERNNGQLTIESTRNQGTTVSIHFKNILFENWS